MLPIRYVMPGYVYMTMFNSYCCRSTAERRVIGPILVPEEEYTTKSPHN